jgi:hypothetical protein
VTQCDDTREFNVARSIGREREGCKTSSDNRGRCRIRTNDQVAGRAADSEDEHWQEECVESSNDRRTNDLGVAHHLWNAERRKRDTGDDVWPELWLIERQKSLQDRQGPPPLTSLLVVCSCGCHDSPEIGCHIRQGPRYMSRLA